MKELSKKKYVTLITIMILVLGIIGIVNIGNVDLDKGKVKLKSASIEKLKSSVIESKGYEEITYPVLYELEKVEGIEERNVIIKGTLTKEENKYARFKEITSNNITSTVSENGREIEIKIEKVKLGRQNKINIKIEINGAINETKIKPEIEIKEESEKEYTKVNTEEIEVKTNSVTGLVQDEEGMSVSNLELSINKGNEEIRRTYTDENGRYVFSDVEEGKYIIKVEEENYELKEIKEVEVIGGITENIIVKKIKPYEIEVNKYISKIKLNNNGKEIEYEYGKLNKVNQTVKNLKNLSGEIEYKIEIKNTGEKSGEITKIEEEVTEGLKFSKEKNSEWEEKNGKIINRSLEGIKLKAGEEKEITLKLDIEKTDEARSYLQKVTAKGEVYQNVVYILGGKEYRKEKVLDGETIEEPKIVQENFKGWYTDKKYTNKYNFKNSVTKDIILYGKIEESTKKYTVQYIDEGKIIKEEELEEGSIINAPEVTKEGYTFDGWYEGEEKYDVYEPITRNLILESKYEINKYKVRFINEDGSVLQEETLDYGSTPTYKKETPTKKRTEEYTYEFDKWTPEITKVTSNQEYKATYKETKNKYTVTYINEGKEYHKETALYGSVITNVKNPTKEGYTFIGWYTKDNEKVSYPITVTENITLYSKYEINSYKVSYYDEGVKYIEDQKINYGENALKPNTDPSKIGYTFKYWSLKENGEEYEFSTKITKDITLYAVYEINKYTVTYINEGIEYHKDTALYGSVITSIQNPTKEGYTFTGWYTKDNKKVSYPITVTKNITLYSKYEINSYKVSYYNEGKKYIDDQKINYGENALKPNTNPSKIGYTFKYWSLKENGEEYEFSTKITKDITLYAVYEINKYTVTYINEGIEYHKETAIYGSVITSIQDPTKAGYTFTGWYNEKEDKINHPITVTENITLHSKYEINTYTVSFYHNNEKYVEDQKVNYGESAVKPSIDPTKEDYNFSGWVIKGTNNKYDFTSKVTKDIELESSFTAKPTYTVTFKIGNEVILTENVIEGHKVTSKEAPYKKGYLFDKWYSDEGLTIENNFDEKIMGNKTIYGKYNENKHTVTYINEGTTYYTEEVLDSFTATGPSVNPEKEGYTFKYFSKDKKVAFDYNAEITEDTTLYAVYEINKYTVTYINEESEYHKEELTYGSKHEKIEDPFKTGYTFIGWYNENEEKVEYPITVTKDITLHSKYEINKYTVTFNDEDRITTKEVNYNNKVEPVINQGKEGYTFKYWSKEKDGEEYNFNTPVTENITLYAVYKINTYTVTYINEGSEYHKEELTYGSKHEKIEDPFKTGYTFIGWYNENEEKVEYPITVTKNITLHSKYEINKYTVTYINEGVKYIDDQQINYKEKAVKPDPNPSKIGYTFKYWSLKENGEEYNFNSEITENITLYAVYSINKYTVTFKNYDGSTLQEETLEYGALPKYKGEAPTREKTKEYTYTFKGWDKEITEVTNNQEYIATYTETKNKYNVKFTNYDGSILQEETLEYGTLPVYKGEVPTREKTDEYTYTFKNWNKEITEVTDNEIYIAVYKEEKNKYTVIYMDGEREYTRKEVNYGETVSEEVINKDHNIYRGWTLEENIYDFNTPVTKNITIKSSFELVESPIIESTPIEWTKENVKVTITTNHNDYSYMYKIDDGEYQNYNGEFTVDKNCTVIAKSIKENVESEVTTKEITNIDKVLPEIKEITEENITTKSFDIKVKGQDNESGLSEIRIYKNEELMVSYPYTERLNEEKEETYSLTGLEENTTYKIKVELIDKVGNKNVSEEKEITTLKRVIVSRIIGRNNSLYESEAEYELFESLEEAITACGSNECTIEMVLDTKESVNVLEGQEIKLELNGKTVTGVRDYTIENSGELIIVDKEDSEGGIINNTDTAIKNIENGILQIGENEEPLSVSTTKPNIVGTTYGIYTEEETSKLKFYDGKIEGNVAIQGNVDDTPYLYNAKITNEGHQVATLSILAEAEAKITGGKYYTKLSNAVSETKSGTYETENENILTKTVDTSYYGFIYDEEQNVIKSNVKGKINTLASSYIKIDLTNYSESQELKINASTNSSTGARGEIFLTKTPFVPSYGSDNNLILRIYGGENSGSITRILEKGNVYYLHLLYNNNYSCEKDATLTINSITLNDYHEEKFNLDFRNDLVTPGTYGFIYQDGVLKSTNHNNSSVANSYIKADMTNYTEDKKVLIDASISSEGNCDFGYVTITDSETVPSYSDENGRVVYISGGVSGTYEATLTAGKINYIHFGYRKDHSNTYGSDTFIVSKIYNATRGSDTPNINTNIPVLNEKVDTVELIKDITLTSPIEINETKEMILDLKGYTLTTSSNDYVIKNSGDLTIIDSKYSSDIEKNQADYEAEQAKNQADYEAEQAEYDKEYNEDLDAYNKTKEEYEKQLEEYEKKLEEYNTAHPNKTYEYTGKEEIYVVPEDGTYKLETWGAQGGSYNETYHGGYGGYSSGYITLKKGDKLYINVGGQGSYIGPYNTGQGGYNGGGSILLTHSDGNEKRATGGGATHISLKSGLLSTLENSKDDILIVSGGGGASQVNSAILDRGWGIGGSGGGISGSSGTGKNYGTDVVAPGGTQTQSTEGNINSYSGVFGKGGENSSTGNSSGGGGGFYGGSSSLRGAGGGSGYIGNSKLTNKAMYCYNCEESSDESTKTISTNDVSETPIANYAKKGAGYAKVTKVGSEDEINNNVSEFNYTGTEETYTVPEDGTYKLETWGSQGSSINSSYIGGYGGYSTGTIKLKKNDVLYINVGGMGSSTSGNANQFSDTGYNGGGKGHNNTSSTDRYASSGGGATHIATKSGLLSTLSDSLDSILIVSGGGSGTWLYNDEWRNNKVGHGGGFIGSTGQGYGSGNTWNASGGTQTGAGENGTKGIFGKGADASDSESAGAGGGFYGGNTSIFSAGGGSGYIGNSKLENKIMYCYNCEESSKESTKTISTTSVSETPIENYAKKGAGHAKITKLDENEETITKPVMPEILKDNNVEIKSDNFSYKALNSSSSGMNISDKKVNFYTSWSNTSVTYYTKKVTVEEGQKLRAKGSLGLWHNYNNGSSLGTAYIGFSKTNDINTTDFDSYTKREITSTTEQKDDFDVMISEPGEYYFKIVLYHISYNSNTLYANLYNLLFTNVPQKKYATLKEATLKEATLTGTITSTTNSVIYNSLGANLTIKEGNISLNKSGWYHIITNSGTISLLENGVLNTKQSDNIGIYNDYNANIKDGGGTINQNSSGYGIYNISKVDDGFSNITFNLNSGYAFYNQYASIELDNIKIINGTAYNIGNGVKLSFNNSIINSLISSNGMGIIEFNNVIHNHNSYDFLDGDITINNSDFNIASNNIHGSSNSKIRFNNSKLSSADINGYDTIEINDSSFDLNGYDHYGNPVISGTNVNIKGKSNIVGVSSSYSCGGLINATNLTIGENDGVISEYPYIKNVSSGCGLKATNLYIYDGSITTYKNKSVMSSITEIEENSKINITTDGDNETLSLVKAEDAVAQIGNETYTSLKSAVDAVKTGETIKILSDIYPIDNFELTNNNFTIDLNSNKVRSFSSDSLFNNAGELNVIDNSENASGSINSVSSTIFKNTGTLNVKNIGVNSINTINNTGTLNINNSKISSSGGYLVTNNEESNMTIESSTLNGGIKNNGNMNINSSNVQSGSITNNNKLTTNNNTISVGVTNNAEKVFDSTSDTYNADINNYGNYTVSETTINQTLNNYGSGIFNINSGMIKSWVYNRDTSTLNISGGTIGYGIENIGTGTVNMTGGNIDTSRNGITNNNGGTINIGTKDGTVNKESPIIKSSSDNGIYNGNGTLNFYDGTIKGKTAISGTINDIEENYDIIKQTENGLEVKYLGREYAAQIESTGEKYYTLKEAIDAVTNTSETVKLLRDITTLPTAETITITDDKNIVLNLNGNVINQGNEVLITNNGTLKFKGSDEDNNDGSIISSSGTIIENNGIFTIEKGTFSSTKTLNNLIDNKGTMVINNVYIPVISSKSNIINSGSLTVNNGTLSAGNMIYNQNTGTLIMNDAKISFWGEFKQFITNEGTAHIYIKSYNMYCSFYNEQSTFVYNKEGANVIIEGFTNIGGYGSIFLNNLGTASIVNSNITSSITQYSPSISNGGNLDITNSSIPSSIYLGNYGNLNLTKTTYDGTMDNYNSGNVTINSGDYGSIQNRSTGFVNLKTGTVSGGISNTNTGIVNIGIKGDKDESGNLLVSQTNPSITSSTYGITNVNNGTVNFYDGIISGTTDTVNGSLNDIEEGYEIISGTTEDGKKSKYLSRSPLVEIESTGKNYYTIQDAIDAITKSEETIKMIRNYTTLNTLETITVPENKNIIIDLNGYKLEQNNEKFLINNGTLTITDSSENSTNKIEMYADKLIENNGTLILDSLNIDIKSTITNVINNKSTLKLVDSSVLNVSNRGGHSLFVENSGTLTLENTTMDFNYYDSDTTVNNTGTLNVIGGNYKIFGGKLFKNSSIVNIKGGTYTFTYWYESYYSAWLLYSTSNEDMTIDSINVISQNNGTKATSIYNSGASNTVNVINSNDQAGTNNASTGTMIITGGTLAGVNNSGMMTVSNSSIGGISNGSRVLDIKESTLSSISNYNGGTINVYDSNVSNNIGNSSIVNFYSGSVASSSIGVSNSGTFNLISGTITSTSNNAISNSGTINIGSKDGNVSTEMPIITGKTYGVSNSDSGKVNFYDGIVSGESGAFYGTVNEVEPGYKIVTNKNDTLTSATLTLVGDDEKVAVLNGINFTSLQDAINSASDTNESIITLYKDVTFESNITVPANKNIKLYLNGYTLNKGSYDFTGEGKITVIDGTSTNALANIMESVKEVLNIEGIKKNIIIYEMDDGSAISSESTYKLYKDNEEVILEEDAIGIYSVGNSNDEIRSANNKIYINELPKGKYKLIGDNNKEVKFEIDESGKIIGNVKENTKETRKLVSTAVAELIIMIQTGIEKVNYIMIILTLLVTISSLLYIVKKVNVKES